MASQRGFFCPKSPQPKPRLGSLFCVDSFLLWINTNSAQHRMQLASRAVFATWRWQAGVSSFNAGQECASTAQPIFCWLKRFLQGFCCGTWVSDDLRDAMSSPCGHYESTRHSGLSHPDQRGSPQENRLLEHETRRLTEELHTRTMWNLGWNIPFMFYVNVYLHRLLICSDFYQHTFSNHSTFTLLGYVIDLDCFKAAFQIIFIVQIVLKISYSMFSHRPNSNLRSSNNATSWEIFFDQIPVSSAFCRCNPLRRGLWTWNDCNERLHPFVNRSKKNNDDDQVEF